MMKFHRGDIVNHRSGYRAVVRAVGNGSLDVALDDGVYVDGVPAEQFVLEVRSSEAVRGKVMVLLDEGDLDALRHAETECQGMRTSGRIAGILDRAQAARR